MCSASNDKVLCILVFFTQKLWFFRLMMHEIDWVLMADLSLDPLGELTALSQTLAGQGLREERLGRERQEGEGG